MRKYKHLFIYIFIILVASCQGTEKSKSVSDENETVAKPYNFYEMRIYYAEEGKLDDLIARFKNHTYDLFEKHGMQNVAYWASTSGDDEILVYLLRYTDENHRKSTWDAFLNDPVWKEAKANSEVDGPLVGSIQSNFLTMTDYSPVLNDQDHSPRVFELRIYTTNEGKLANLHNRFSDHTMKLFEKNGMSNVSYFNVEPGQDNFENTLVYFISHESEEKAAINWQEFIEDPNWVEVWEASNVDGKIVKEIESHYLYSLDFSPIK